ncbi:hypothetical protein ACYOEI_23515 [Singulisphaera rosea]
MDPIHSLTWRVAGMPFELATLGHRDLDVLYKQRLLPLVGPLEAKFRRPADADTQAEGRAIDALSRCLDSFRAILSAALRKARPRMTAMEATSLVAYYCGDLSSNEESGMLYRQVRLLGEISLPRLDSQHRERFASLVALAGEFEGSSHSS